jgi:hypothetical protein
MEYPLFFRHKGRCIRQDGPTEAWIITLPPDAKVPLRQHLVTDSAEYIEHLKEGMQPTTAEHFRSFLFTFYRSVGEEYQRASGLQISASSPIQKQTP